MSGRAADRRWDSSFWLWDLYVVGGCAAIAIGLFFVGDPAAPHPLWGALALCGIAACHLVVGRRVILSRERGWRAQAFVAAILVLFVAAVLFAPASMSAIVVLYPLTFMSLPLGKALAVTTLVTAIPVVTVVVKFGWDAAQTRMVLSVGLMAFVVAPLIGTWITRTVLQSEERADLLDELAARRADVERLSRDAGTAAERARLAREIHDTLAQGFTSIVALAQAIESELDSAPEQAKRHLALVASTARENLVEARAMVATLTPSALGAGTLVDAVRRQAQRLALESGIAVEVEAPADLRRLPTAAEVVLLRSAQEALANVGRHAHATRVTVHIEETADGVLLRTVDDGAGFDVTSVEGYGLSGMRARAEEAGGSCRVSSTPGAGTAVEVEVPA
ncbi:sensor histidine kinase [Antrihabitans sp. YC2-6]|uniref:sensor histidine kinase n=1 Tax=Antrihabitans sp. YC2-6 TaxID=2799498 RepID=UPI0018F3E82F|nr:sensor histidine kinase [Antrihabitans sp. YC2-6]MBJ8346310.1 sensor histidine kinase [Antrihabitans sp. YC2-6]